jgi:hypothetical protein
MNYHEARFSMFQIPADAAPDDLVIAPAAKQPAVSDLRSVYTMERNVWQVVCEGESSRKYVPGKKWEGEPASNSIEDKPSNVTWSTINRRLQSFLPDHITPTAYTRQLFWALRYRRDMPPPSPAQLYSSSYLEVGLKAEAHAARLIKLYYISQVSSLKAGTVVRHLGEGSSELRALYQTLLARDNGYTPLFVHSMAATTTNSVRASDLRVGDTKYVELLDKLAERTKIAAVLEYTVFPSYYNATWGSVLAPGLLKAADGLLSKIVSSFVS